MAALTRLQDRCPTPGKIAYATAARANRAITNAHITGTVTSPLRAYICPCGAYHLSSVRKSAWREQRTAARRAMLA